MFEKKVLQLAESCGITRAYFAYGTMYACPDCAAPGAIRRFTTLYRQQFTGDVQVTSGREELAIDFTLPQA